MGEVVRELAVSVILVRDKAKFSILCDVMFLVRPQEKFEIDYSQEQKGKALQ